MFSRHRLAEVAALLGDATRAGMLLALWDGRAESAGELARLTGVTASTASSHLGALVTAGLLQVEPHGRRRLYRISGAPVARALEALAELVPPHHPAGAAAAAPALHQARMCYDHIAGRLGVAISDALFARRVLARKDGGFGLGPAGRPWLARLGIDIASLEHRRRPLARSCLDWTERREHLSGALGAALAGELLERDWIRRERGARTLLVTTAGRVGLKRLLGVSVDSGSNG